MNDQVTLIIKVTGRCNLACSYCFYTQLGARQLPARLDLEDLCVILEKAAHRWRTVRVIFHGGEPLLLGVPYFERILRYESALTRTAGIHFRNCLQTNGTIFNKDIAAFLRTYNVGVGLSIDGTAGVHAQNRPFKGLSARNSFQHALETLDQMNKEMLRVSCIVVATRATVQHPDEIYMFFKSRRLDFKINELVTAPHQQDLLPTQEEMASFICRLFDLWIHDTTLPAIRVRPLSSIVSSFWSGRVLDCTHRSCCNTFLSVETDGSVYVCGRFNHLPDFRMGNILAQSWEDILRSPVAQRFDQRRERLPGDCQTCEWLTKCWGGCTASAAINRNGLWDKTHWCEARRRIFSHIQKSLSEILSAREELDGTHHGYFRSTAQAKSDTARTNGRTA